MIRNIVIAWSIMLATPVFTMKRMRDYSRKNSNPKKICLEPKAQLPSEIQQLIFDMAIDIQHSLHSCIATIKACALTNRTQYKIFDNKKYSDELIEKLSKKFCCSHETVTKNLHTPQANHRLLLQNELFSLCLNSNFAYTATQQFNTLIEQGVNVDFTYAQSHQPKTLLMINRHKLTNIKYQKIRHSAFYCLTTKANFNQQTPDHTTLLMTVVKCPINHNVAQKIINHEKININEQNSYGETALLYCIKNRQKNIMTSLFVKTIEMLLKKGADPLLADKNGYTPLAGLYDIPDLSEMKDNVIQLLEDSIKTRSQAQ